MHRLVPAGPVYSQATNNIMVGTRVSDGFPPPPQVDFNSAKNPAGSVIGVFPRFTTAYAQQFNLTVQHEVAPWKTVLSAGYVGNLGRRLGTSIDLNQPFPGLGAVGPRRPFFAKDPNLASVTYVVSDGLSNFNAFDATVNTRMSQGLSLLFGYTWSHAIDDVGTEFGGGAGTPQDIRNRPADRGNSVYDVHHRATLNSTYHLPWRKGQRCLNHGGALDRIAGAGSTNVSL